MIFLKEYLKLRTETTKELTHLEVDQNFQYVANPWNPKRKYKEGMIVYTGDNSTSGSGSLTWFRARVDNGPSVTFNPAEWDAVGANSISGSIYVEDSNNVLQATSTLKFDSSFLISFLGDTAVVSVDPSALDKWQDSISPNTIYSNDNVLIGLSTEVSPTYKLTVAGNQLITGDLNVSGLIDGINLNNFYNDYVQHTHTLVPPSMINYASLYPFSNGALADVSINTGTLVNGDTIVWNNSLKRWVNQTLTTGPHTLGSHTDVAPSVSVAPSNNQILRFNSGTSLWENVTVVPNTNTGFATAPFLHDHDGVYWTKTQLSAFTGPIIEWANIFNAPSIPPGNAPYVVTSLTGGLSNERAITAGTGISLTDNGGNNTLVVAVVPGTTNQLVNVLSSDNPVGTRPTLNFIQPPSGWLLYTITDDVLNNKVDISIDFDNSMLPTSPVISVNSFTGAVSLGVADMNDVTIIPSNFPGPGVGSPFNVNSNILVYDDDIAKWVNVPVSAIMAGLSNLALDDLIDVEIGITSLFDKDLLYYDQTSGLWVNGPAADANLYTITQLQGGALNTIYYTKTELQTPGLATIDWANIVNEPLFAPFNHTHYLYQIADVKNYFATPPSNGDTLVWNSTFQYWEPSAGGGGGGFSTVINNSTISGTYSSGPNITINPSNVNPLKFQADLGITLETDSTNNLIKIGLLVDPTAFTFNTAGELTLVGETDGCFTYIFTNLFADIPATTPNHGLGTSDLVVTVYDNAGYIIDADVRVTNTTITIEVATDLTNVKVTAVRCGTTVIGSGGGAIDTFGDLVTPLPTDGSFLDGVFPWDVNTKIVDAFDDINELLTALVPPSAPILSDWTGSKAGITVSGKLSFDTSNPITAATYFGADTAPVSPVSVDGTWTISGKRLGITANLTGDITGVLNDQVTLHGGLPTPAYQADMFGDADKGELRLFVNGVLTSALDLESSTGAMDNTSGGTVSGFVVSAQSPSFFSSGSPFILFQNRTGTWRLVDNDVNIRQGYNYVIVQHIDGAFTRTLTRFEFILDDNTTATAFSGQVLNTLAMTGTKKLSGIDYHTGGTAKYSVNIDNMYRNTYYSGADAITHTGNSNTYGVLLTAAQQALGACAGNEALQVNIVNKTATITSSGVRIINNSISLNTTGKRTVQSNLTGGSASINNILLDNVAASSTNTIENFDDETQRLNTLSDYDSIGDVTAGANIWDSLQSLFDGSAGHTDGLQVIDGKLIYPGNSGSYPTDFQTSAIPNGSTFNDGGVGGTGRDYAPCVGNRTYIRKFLQVSPTTGNFTMNIQGSGGTFVGLGTALTGNNIHVEIKGPTETGWMDAYEDFVTGNFSDGDGARSSGAGAGRAFNTTWGLTIGTKNTANTGGYMVIRITVGPAFTGEITQINWTFS